jgi:methyl-accepting chemotaxis protein
VVIAVLVGAIGTAVQFRLSSTLRDNVDEKLTVQTKAEADRLTQFLVSHRTPTALVSNHPRLGMDDTDRLGSFLDDQKLKKLPRTVEELHIVTLDNASVVVSTASGVSAGDDFSDYPWAEGTTYTGFDNVVISDPYTNTEGETVIAFLSIVKESPTQVLAVTVRVSAMRENFANTIDGEFTQVVDDEGRVVFAPETNETLKPYLTGTNATAIVVERGTEREAGFLREGKKERELDGDYIQAYAPVGGTEWVVVKHAPTAEAYALESTVRWGVIGVIVVALAGVAVLGVTLGRNTAQAVTRLSQKASAVESGDYDVELTRDRRDEIGELVDAIDSMRDTLVERLADAEEAREDAAAARQRAETARERAEQLNEQLEARAESYGEVMAACADGDLTRRMEETADSDAMASIAVSFNQMLDEWEQTIVELTEFAADVDTASEHAWETTAEIRAASERVSEATRTITDATDQQRSQIDEVNKEVSQLSATVEQITATAQTVAQRAADAAETGADGRAAAESALTELGTIESEATAAVEAIEELTDQMERIDEIVGFITEIADQTNLLALNAAIEAARAGEEGNGFAVVAEEVKSLAAETQEAATEIEQVVAEVQATADETADDIHQMSDRVDEGTATVERALSALDEMASEAEETNVGVQEIESATEQQAVVTEEVAGLADRVADVADTTAEETQTVAAQAEQQSEAVTEVAETVSTLSERATHLNEQLDQFAVEQSDAATEDSTPELVADGAASPPELPDE